MTGNRRQATLPTCRCVAYALPTSDMVASGWNADGCWLSTGPM